MTEKDFSTIKKTLHILQKVQATAKVYAFWISFTHYEDSDAACVTLFRTADEKSKGFDFYTFYDPQKRLEMYNKMMDFINGKEL